MHLYRIVSSALLMTILAAPALAVPRLQLDIYNGTYDNVTETVISPGDEFTLYAYATPQGNLSAQNILDGKFYLSVALMPMTEPADNASIGSFEIDSVMYGLSDMIYGVPPVELLGGDQGHDGGDLSQHSIFETYFLELEFMFSGGDTSGEYNTEDDTGQGPIVGSDMYYRAFDVDVTSLAADYDLHFDLYTTDVSKQDDTDLDAGLFAPFSHDAETGRNTPPTDMGHTPEPTTSLLSLLGLAALGKAAKRRHG